MKRRVQKKTAGRPKGAKAKPRPPVRIVSGVAYNLEEAAARLRIAEATAARLFADGEIPAKKVPGGWRVMGDALTDYINGTLPVSEEES